MKRLLALLLALILPGCAAAETVGLSLSVELDEVVFAAYTKQALQAAEPQFASYDLDALSAALAKSLNGLNADVAIQEDALAVKIDLANGELLNMAIHTTQDAVYMTSPMLSGYALWEHLQDTSEKQIVLEETDWKSVLDGVADAVTDWSLNFEPMVMQGSFDGDAYSGGTQCLTWMLSDKDVAALISALATEDVREVFINLMQVMADVDGSVLLTKLDELNVKVAEADAYLYMLRVVTNDADEFVGASLTIMDAVSQIATCSVGMTDNAVKLVLGLGLNEQNYWWDISIKQTRQENITYLSGTSREWLADKSESYSYVSATNAPLASYLLRCSLTRSGERLLWDGSISLDTEASSEPVCSVSGSYICETGTFDCSVGIGGSGSSAPMRLKLRLGPVESIPPLDSTLKLCSTFTDADAALYEELTQKFAASLLARLIKLLPMDLIMTINQFTLPQ